MTYDEKIRWLRRYRDALRMERELQDELKEQKTRAVRMAATITGMPSAGGDGQALPCAVERILQIQQELETQIAACCAIRHEVIEVIDTIADERDHEIIRRRYLLGQTYEKIAESLGISVRYCIKLHENIIKKLIFTNKYLTTKS